MTNERFYIKKARIHDKNNPSEFLTLRDVCELLNKQDKDIQLCIKAMRTYDGRRLFDTSYLSFADVLNKVLHDE